MSNFTMKFTFVLAQVCGYVSILCWVLVFTPQIRENYLTKSGESLSLTFLWIWLVGDIFNILGLVIDHYMWTMLILAVYYTISDAVLIYQVYYYRRRRHYEEELAFLGNEPAYPSESLTFWTITTLGLWITAFILDSTGFTLSEIFGWLSAILYVGSRIPQIYKNHKRSSVDGLSPAMFLCSIIGNLTFCTSIVLGYAHSAEIWQKLPWLVGAIGTLLFDLVIALQFYLYTTCVTIA